MKTKKLSRRLLCLVVSLAAVLVWMVSAAAQGSLPLRIKLTPLTGGTLSYAVEGDADLGDVTAFSAVYSGGQMTGVQKDELKLSDETSGTVAFTAPYDTAKTFLFDPETFVPLGKPGRQVEAVFTDYDGTVLSQQQVWSGHRADYPVVTDREGYYFAGWNQPLTELYEDAAYEAVYIPLSSPNIFTVSSASGKSGEQVTLSVDLTGAVELCGFDMALSYDGEVLKFVSLDAEHSMDVVANHVSADGKIYFNFSSRQNRTTDGKILTATFTVKSGAEHDAVVTLMPTTVVAAATGETIVSVNYSLAEGVVHIQ